MSLNTCLKGYFTLEGCDTSTLGNSGYYLNRLLEGLEFKMLDQIANEQQSTFAGVWSDLQDRAIEMFSHDLNQQMNERFRLKGIKQSVDMGLDSLDDASAISGASKLRGFKLEQNSATDTLTDSNLAQFYIQTIKFYAGSTEDDITFNVWDLDRNRILGTYTKTSITANQWHTLDVYAHFDAKRIAVLYDATSRDTYSFDISKIRQAVQNPQVSDNFYFDEFNDYGCGVDIRGYQSQGSATNQVELGNETYGVSAEWSLVCKWDNLVCQNKDHFKMALAYCLGVEICNQRLYTSRLNEFTIFDRETSAGLKQLYLTKYKGGILDEIQYDGLLPVAVRGMNIDKHDGCIECNSNMNFTDALL